jgi:hypothetical protein
MQRKAAPNLYRKRYKRVRRRGPAREKPCRVNYLTRSPPIFSIVSVSRSGRGSSTVRDRFPTSADGLTPQLLTELLAEHNPGAAVQSLQVIESKAYGDGMVSTAGRIVVDLDYAPTSAESLPRRLVIKVARSDQRFSKSLYANEVAVYNRLQPARFLEAPRAFGAAYDAATASFCLLLEDLRQREASFPNVKVEINLEQLRALLAVLGKLHARYWQSPQLATELGWLQTHLAGDIQQFCNDPAQLPAMIEAQVATEQFKREMVQRLGTTVDRLYQGVRLVQQHQARLPQTVLHGDTHIGNTYLLPGDRGGLLDWQLAVRGYCMHDVSYLLATGLSVAMRRRHERELLQHYRDSLQQAGLREPPGEAEIWLEYRRAAVWPVYIGWLTTPTANYGWEICVLNHLRVMTAYEDLETGKLLDSMR